MKSARPYRQVARAQASAELHGRVLDAVDALFLPSADSAAFSLPDVAHNAGTTVQTVLRHFGTKAGLIAAAAERGTQRVLEQRRAVPVGDTAATAAYLAAHYEEVGSWVLRLLQLEVQLPSVAVVTDSGRQMHRRWVEESLVPLLGPAPAAARRRHSAVLVAVTDLLTWRVLRHEQGLRQDDYQQALHDTLDAVVAASWTPGGP